MRTIALVLVYAAVAAAGTYLTFRPVFDSGFERTVTERGDGLLNHYLLEHSWLALGDPNYIGTLVSPPCFFPQRFTIFYSETLWGTAPMYWAIRLVCPYDTAYQWWQILVNLPNFLAFAVVMRWLKVPHPLALLGAFLWAFAAVHAEHLKHQQLVARYWMPLAVYYAYVLATAPTVRAWAKLLGCVFLQCVTCVYTGWFLAVGLAVFFPALVALTPGAIGRLAELRKTENRNVVLVFVAWMLGMLALFGPYAATNMGRARGYGECYGMMPPVGGWFAAPPGTPWHDTFAHHFEDMNAENVIFSGFALYALFLAAAVHTVRVRAGLNGARPLVAAGLVAAGAWVLLTLAWYPEGYSLWYVARFIPGGTAIRAVARVYVIVYLFATIAALVWLGVVSQRLRPGRRAALFAAVVALVTFEQLGVRRDSFPKSDFYPRVDRAAEAARGAPAAWIVSRYTCEAGELEWPYSDIFAMWVGLRANVPVVNGYSGREPDGYPDYGARTEEQARKWLTGRYRGPLRVVDPDAPERARTSTIE